MRKFMLSGLIVVAVVLSGCDALASGAATNGISGPGKEQEAAPQADIEQEAVPQEAEIPADVEAGPDIEEAAPASDIEEAPAAQQPAPPLNLWPMSADLFYRNVSGEVWWQPLEGDEALASRITRADQFVYDFDIAPGGDWMLYRTDAFLGVTSLDGASGQIVDDGIGLPVENARGLTVAYSPDASKFAYSTATGFRVYIPGAGPDFGPLVYDAPESSPVGDVAWSVDSEWLLVWQQAGQATLYQSSPVLSMWVTLGALNGYAWLDDGRLAFAPREGGLAVVDPADLNSRQFLVPQERQVSLPTQRPDGTLVYFIHPAGVNQIGFLHSSDPDTLAFRQESQAPVMTGGMHWDPSGTLVVGAADDNQNTMKAINPMTGGEAGIDAVGEITGLDWGDLPPETVASLPMERDLYFIAPDVLGVEQVWRLPGDGEPAETLTNAVANVTAYALTEDASTLAYASEGIIYTTPTGSSNPIQVAAVAEDAYSREGTMSFSPDGTELAYTSGGIWVIDLEAGTQRRLIEDNIPFRPEDERLIEIYTMPEWSPGGAWLTIRINYYEGYDVALLSPVGFPSRNPIPLNLYQSRARWVSDGLLMVLNDGQFFGEPALYEVIPGSPADIEQVTELPVQDALWDDGEYALLARQIPIYSPGPTSVRVYGIDDIGDGEPEPVTPAMVIEEAVLSPSALLVAGLTSTQYTASNHIAGQLTVINPLTSEEFAIEGITLAWHLQWGP